jgi:DNA-binding NarL/FixJ family response regulator
MVVIAPDVQPGDIRVAFTHGVTSYVIEGEAIPFLGTCLAEVIVNSAKGMNCLAPTAATVLVNRIQATTRRNAGTILSRRTVPHPEGQPLTTREASIMHMLASGSSISEVATQLCLSKYTIRNNMSHIFAKLGVHRQPEAVLAWIRHRQHGGR